MNVIRKDATITNTDDGFPGAFEVILSAPTKDRDGDTLLPDEWKTPLPEHITFDSDHGMSVATTVGSGVPRIDAKTGNLVVSGRYSSLPRAQEVRTLVNEGHIRTTSVAFMSEKTQKDGVTVTRRELLNGAFVAVPSNREALVLSSKGVKAGARNSANDAQLIQQIHDLSIELGATETVAAAAAGKGFQASVKGGVLPKVGDRVVIDPARQHEPGQSSGTVAEIGTTAYGVIIDQMPEAGVHRWYTADEFTVVPASGMSSMMPAKSLSGRVNSKTIAGSLEAVQDRAHDAVQDAYPGYEVTLIATIPDGRGGGSLVYQVEDPTSNGSQEFQQPYTDDGTVITLTGDPVPVEVMEIVTPDPEEASEAAGTGVAPAPATGAQAPVAGARSAPVNNAHTLELQARAARMRLLGTLSNIS